MFKQKFLPIFIALILGISTLTAGAALPQAMAQAEAVGASSGGAPVDLAIANEEKLIDMLKNIGTLDEDATPEEAEEALQHYLEKKEANTRSDDGELAKEARKVRERVAKAHDKIGLHKHHKHKEKKKKGVDPVAPQQWNGEVRKDKVLVVLIDYPDFKHNNIAPGETDMYYKNFDRKHYEEMLFGENGYVGPNGKRLQSVKQYLEEQSGGSYTIEGAVAGWYTADHQAAYYGGNVPDENGNDARPRELVVEALSKAAEDPAVDLSQFDQEDRYDLSGTGNYREPDGIVDHVMIVHAGIGEEAGGGALGPDAIWSHRWNLGQVTPIPGTEAEVDYWDGQMAAYDYTVVAEDSAAGILAHEYSHDLGLPDEYDTQYTGRGEPVSYWSIMASGSWTGKIAGTEPSGYSAWAKERLQATVGGNWLSGTTVYIDSLDKKGTEVLLDQASTKGQNNDAVRVDLPKKETVITKPYSGKYVYFGGRDLSADTSMTTALDLTGANQASLTFKTWYEIEEHWDYATVQVKEAGADQWVTVSGNITTKDNPNGQNPGDGITGFSDGWVDAAFDLSAYAGKKIELRFNYWTDRYVVEAGIYLDDIRVTADGKELLFDNAEGDSAFVLDGFTRDNGKRYTDHYYLLEWRTHTGADAGLSRIAVGDNFMSYDPGLVVWYVDDNYEYNWVGIHPGDGFLGVVDADQKVLKWSDKSVAGTRYQIHDAAFNINKGKKMYLDMREQLGVTLKDNHVKAYKEFSDRKSYSSKLIPDAGRNIPKYGLNVRVLETSKDKERGVVKIKLSRDRK
ncbi:immune inhibitor A domain-containing protein [Numidum massiliense]|uniref:immune inhibitor A domain-containing protein n=1 Tax=Numidum massiliense TaxID=1522315 RepID=UPI0006D58E42|nr:immune inhibitor A domain-containing protein [Numidum massiliense]